MYLSYSGWKTYSKCARMYWFMYVLKPLLETPDNRVNTLYGHIVGRLFELFYNERIWNTKGVEAQLLARVQESYDIAVRKETKDGVILWKGDDKKALWPSPEALLDDVRETVPRGLRIIRHHRLLGADAAAEVKLDHYVKGHLIGGRCDIIMRRIAPHHDLILLDGKGSRHRDKYVEARQLKWYAMLYRMKHGHMPDRLGFVFWRYEPDESVDWVDTSLNELDELQGSVLTSISEIESAKLQVEADPSSARQAFPAHPGSECKLCAYFELCPEGKNFASLTPPVHQGTGVDDVGL
jgi:hypothetical protein